MDIPGGIGGPVNKKEWFPRTVLRFYGLIRIVGVPEFPDLTFDRLRIEVGGDFLHKTPLDYLLDAQDVRDGMLVLKDKVVFLLILAALVSDASKKPAHNRKSQVIYGSFLH